MCISIDLYRKWWLLVTHIAFYDNLNDHYNYLKRYCENMNFLLNIELEYSSEGIDDVLYFIITMTKTTASIRRTIYVLKITQKAIF